MPDGSKRRPIAVNRGLNKLGDSVDWIIERVAWDRSAARVPDKLLYLSARHTWGCGRARAVNDTLFNDRSIQIIGAEPQCNLSQSGSQGDPIRFNVRKIIEHQPRDGNRLQIIYSSRRGQVSVNG